MLNIKTATDPVELKGFNVVIYGQPGIGKTSLAFSAEKPLLLDFDNGAHRSEYRKDFVPISDWSEIASIQAADIKDYSTIIIDTVDTCLDYLAANIINRNPKMGNRNGGLTMQGWGALKNEFSEFLKRMKTFGKTVILICHVTEEKRGDDTFFRPLVKGGSKDMINQVADLMGYYFAENNQRVLNFNPTDRWLGKNSASIEPLLIPNLDADPNYFAEVLAGAMNKIITLSEKQAQAREAFEALKEAIETIETPKQVNELGANLKKLESQAHYHMARTLLGKKAKSLGFDFDKTGCFDPNAEESVQLHNPETTETEVAENA